jgi:acetyl-CoA acyltransferase 1
MLFASSLLLKRAIFSTVTRARHCDISILDKRYDDVVITFAKRTAVGRAKKGQFKDTPVDELLHALFKV